MTRNENNGDQGSNAGGNDSSGNSIARSKRQRRRRRCFCVDKDDFFPEESFRNWGNYMKALSNTIPRLKDRLVSRSMDSLELQDVRARSENEFKRTLNWWDLIWFGMGAVMGAGIFVLTGEAAKLDAGPAVVVSYFISGVCAMLSVLCYSEFAVELPVAGGSYAYLRVELGDFVAYIAAGNILFEYIVAGASVARSWTSYFATLCNSEPNSFRIHVSSMATDYNNLDPIAVGISFLVCVAASWSMKASSRFNSITTILHLLVLVFILVAGFDGVATLGEEVKNPGRDIPLGLIGSMTIVIIFYCSLAACLTLMQPYTQIDTDAAFSIAFKSAGSSCGTSAYWAYGRSGGWIGYAITVPIWFLGTLGLQVFVKMARKPKFWGVPFLPWLPSASVAMNVFVMGSIDSASFVSQGD
ncbi:Cationic amino acid transporter 1 [Linum grandiflorum]